MVDCTFTMEEDVRRRTRRLHTCAGLLEKHYESFVAQNTPFWVGGGIWVTFWYFLGGPICIRACVASFTCGSIVRDQSRCCCLRLQKFWNEILYFLVRLLALQCRFVGFGLLLMMIFASDLFEWPVHTLGWQANLVICQCLVPWCLSSNELEDVRLKIFSCSGADVKNTIFKISGALYDNNSLDQTKHAVGFWFLMSWGG